MTVSFNPSTGKLFYTKIVNQWKVNGLKPTSLGEKLRFSFTFVASEKRLSAFFIRVSIYTMEI